MVACGVAISDGRSCSVFWKYLILQIITELPVPVFPGNVHGVLRLFGGGIDDVAPFQRRIRLK